MGNKRLDYDILTFMETKYLFGLDQHQNYASVGNSELRLLCGPLLTLLRKPDKLGCWPRLCPIVFDIP